MARLTPRALIAWFCVLAIFAQAMLVPLMQGRALAADLGALGSTICHVADGSETPDPTPVHSHHDGAPDCCLAGCAQQVLGTAPEAGATPTPRPYVRIATRFGADDPVFRPSLAHRFQARAPPLPV